MPRKKKTEKQLAKDRCDDLWSELVKMRAGFKCEVCQRKDTLNSHHIYSRANHAVRHDPDNGVCLCVSHHTFNSRFSAHLTPADFIDWITEKRGKEWLTALRIRAKSSIGRIDFKLMALYLKKQIETLKNDLKA